MDNKILMWVGIISVLVIIIVVFMVKKEKYTQSEIYTQPNISSNKLRRQQQRVVFLKSLGFGPNLKPTDAN